MNTKHITLVNYPRAHGYLLRLKRGEYRYSRYFMVPKWGSFEAALAAAVQTRDEIEKALDSGATPEDIFRQYRKTERGAK